MHMTNAKNNVKGGLPKPPSTATPLGSKPAKGKPNPSKAEAAALDEAAHAAIARQAAGKSADTTSKAAAAPPPPAAGQVLPPGPAAEKPKRVPVNRDQKMTPRDIALQKVNATSKRWVRLAKYVEAWTEGTVAEAVARIGVALVDARAALQELPAGYTPPRSEKGGAKVVIGTFVQLRERVAVQYDDVLDPDDRKAMKVESFRKGRVVVRTKSGEKIILPRGHVSIDEEAEKAAKAAESMAAAARADQAAD